jgi:hypothetical protein
METPFDRGEVDRASLEATERLRQRLARDRARESETGRARFPLLPWSLAGALLLFAGGMIANPWFEANVRARLPFATAEQPADDAMSVLAARLAALETKPETTAEDGDEAKKAPAEERLARTEARVETSTDLLAREADRIDRLTADVAAMQALLEADRARGEAAVGAVTAAADRSEAMLAVMLARRAVDDGRALGAVEAPLRRAFEARYPDAVRDVARLGEAPVSISRLRRDLAALGPLEGDQPGTGQSWWGVFAARVKRLVRPADTLPGPAPRSAADMALARGDVAEAAEALRQLPAPRPAAVNRWLATADRLSQGEAALRQLETAALIPPPKPEPAAIADGEEAPAKAR